MFHRCARTASDRTEDVSGRGEARLNPGELRMHTAGYNSTHSRHELRFWRVRDNARGCADHVDDVAFFRACADGVPVSVECSDRNRNPGAESQLLSPLWRERSGDLVGSRILAIQFVARPGEERINLGEETFGGKSAERGVPHPLVPHGADAALDAARVGDPTERGRNHVAVLEGADEFVAFFGIMA